MSKNIECSVASSGLLIIGVTDEKKVLDIDNDLQTIHPNKQNEYELKLRVLELSDNILRKNLQNLLQLSLNKYVIKNNAN